MYLFELLRVILIELYILKNHFKKVEGKNIKTKRKIFERFI